MIVTGVVVVDDVVTVAPVLIVEDVVVVTGDPVGFKVIGDLVGDLLGDFVGPSVTGLDEGALLKQGPFWQHSPQ